jgi:hypothetical protein
LIIAQLHPIRKVVTLLLIAEILQAPLVAFISTVVQSKLPSHQVLYQRPMTPPFLSLHLLNFQIRTTLVDLGVNMLALYLCIQASVTTFALLDGVSGTRMILEQVTSSLLNTTMEEVAPGLLRVLHLLLS